MRNPPRNGDTAAPRPGGAPASAAGTVVVRCLVAAAVATALETAARGLAPAPFAPRPEDVAASLLLYGLAASPALLALASPRLAYLERLFLALPGALLLANLGYAFGIASARMLLLVAAGGLAAAALAQWTVRARALVPAALLLGIAAAGMHAVGRQRHADAAQPSVLLVVLDTTAATHLSPYGYARPTSPTLAALAERSLVYRRALATAPWTLPSHASIFFGRYPSELGFDGWHIDRGHVEGSMASDLAATGRETAAIAANPIIPAVSTLTTGFRAAWRVEALTTPLLLKLLDRARGRQGFQSRGDRVTDLALDWLDRLSTRGRPWFLFLNYLDPHAPYRPPSRERERFAPGIDPSVVAYDMETYNSGRAALTDPVRAAMVGLYDGEVAAVDAALGRLLAALTARGYGPENLLLIVTADHGESLGGHGFVGHLLGLPDEVLRVPLLLAGPGVAAGEVTAPVQLVQLRATVRALAGLEPLQGIAGPLPPWGESPALLVAEHPEPQWYLDELRGFNARVDAEPWQGYWVAVERNGTKVVFDDRGRGATYDLTRDPDERSPAPLADGAALVRAYQTWSAEHPRPQAHPLSEETRRALGAIGYLN